MSARPSIAAGIRAIEARWPGVAGDDPSDPVFLLASGWRSGSTLLQRLIMPSCFLWGEPFGHSGLIDGLAEPIRCAHTGWPMDQFFYRGQDPRDLTARWIANLYPDMADLVAAQRGYLDALLGAPSRRAGAGRWGFKEVRLTADHAALLRWLYPRAALLFLVRNPFDSWRSYAAIRARGGRWFYHYTDPVIDAEGFAERWAERAGSFLDHAEGLGALLIRYEDLTAGHLAPIEDYLGFPLAAGALALNPRGSLPTPDRTLAESDRRAVARGAGVTLARLGYADPEGPLAPISG